MFACYIEYLREQAKMHLLVNVMECRENTFLLGRESIIDSRLTNGQETTEILILLFVLLNFTIV